MAQSVSHLVIVPHTHWDREWYRSQEHFRFRLVNLIDGLLDLLEGDPSFRHFTLDGQAIVLDDYLDVRPESRERLVKLIEAGRLLVGPWYVLPDEWLVSGEALIRNLRLGLARSEAMGGGMRVGYVPDQFGHVGQLPQIFAGFGFSAAALWRGVGDDVDQTLFDWVAPDGTRLLTAYLARGYGHGGGLPLDPDLLAKRLSAEIEGLASMSPIPTLLVMNGNDHADPDAGLAEALPEALDRLPGVSAEIATLPHYLERARVEAPAERPVHHGELRSGLRSPLLPGCASTRLRQKQADFRNDRLLVRYLEPLAVWLQQLGGNPDASMIDFAWRVALENHPHDSICGCSIDSVHDQMDSRFERVRQLAEAHLERVQADLAGYLAAPSGAEAPVARWAVWNPQAAGSGPIEGELEIVEEPDAKTPQRLRARDAAGNWIPTAVERLEPACSDLALTLPAAFVDGFIDREFADFLGHWVSDVELSGSGAERTLTLHVVRRRPSGGAVAARRAEARRLLADPEIERVRLRSLRAARYRVRCIAPLPAQGLRIFDFLPAPVAEPDGVRAVEDGVGSGTLENGDWRIGIDPDAGLSIEHRASGARSSDALRIVSEGDRGDEYNFDPVPGGEIIDEPVSRRIRSLACDATRARAELEWRYEVPAALNPDRDARSSERVPLVVAIHLDLWIDSDRIDFGIRLENSARDHRLRAVFRTPHPATCLEVESAFEIAERPVDVPAPDPTGHFQAEWPVGATPQRSFATLSGGERATTIANRGSTEVEALRIRDVGGAGEGDGALAVTLLRAVGWLSRGDLVLRPAHAGPAAETPGAQVPGPHRAEFSMRWHPAGQDGRVTEAHRFANPPLAWQCLDPATGGSSLEEGARLLELDDPELVVSAIEPTADGQLRVRLYNPSPEPRRTQVRCAMAPGSFLEAVDLEDRPEPATALRWDGSRRRGTLELRPWQIATLRTRRT